jgi:hypothetical protein
MADLVIAAIFPSVSCQHHLTVSRFIERILWANLVQLETKRSQRPRWPAARQCSREHQDRSHDCLVLRKLGTSVSGSEEIAADDDVQFLAALVSP